MTYKELLQKIKNDEISIEQAFEELSKFGFCPNLLSDDNEKWAVCLDGFQGVSTNNEEDIITSFYVESNMWHSSIRKALIYAITEEQEY